MEQLWNIWKINSTILCLKFLKSKIHFKNRRRQLKANRNSRKNFYNHFFFFNLFAFNVLRHSCKADKCQRNDVCYSADNKRNVWQLPSRLHFVLFVLFCCNSIVWNVLCSAWYFYYGHDKHCICNFGRFIYSNAQNDFKNTTVQRRL